MKNDRLYILPAYYTSNYIRDVTYELSTYTMSQKKLCKIVLSELCQISTNFDNFWQKDGKEAKIMRDALIFHLI